MGEPNDSSIFIALLLGGIVTVYFDDSIPLARSTLHIVVVAGHGEKTVTDFSTVPLWKSCRSLSIGP